MDLVEIPAGWFWMGWEHGHPGERPRHRVWLDRFAIARAPVTNREYAAFLAAGATEPPAWWRDPRFDDPEQPVVGVSWFDASRFCDWLAEREGCPTGSPPRPSGRRRRGRARGRALSLGRRPARRTRPSIARLAPPRRPPTRSDLLALSGRLPRVVPRLGRRGLLRALAGAEPAGTGDRARAACPAAAPGATRTRGARWPTAPPCPRRCATRTTASEWCEGALTRATPRAARPRPGPASSACPSRGAGPPPR